MKKLKLIFNILSLVFVRFAHVFEHLTCDEVPSFDCDDDDYDESFYGSYDDKEV